MISADIPMTINSTANSLLSLPDFIEYSIKNDLNIVTVKWLAHIKKLPIGEAKSALKSYWDSIGKGKGFCATFSVLSHSETENCYFMELIDSDKFDTVNGVVLSSEIYAIHAIPLKDESVQLGMINAPIFDLPGEIEAPWIDSKNNEIIVKAVEPVNVTATINVNQSQTATSLSVANDVVSQPPGKKMKMVQKTRTFVHDGYQQVETYNELVPCDDNEDEPAASTDVEMGNNKSQTVETSKPPVAPAQTKSKQSSMMSFFKKK